MPDCRLLVVEDDRLVADVVRRIAAEAGFDTRATSDFAVIHQLYDEFLPQVIVLDILMPDMDGFEILTFLNKRSSTSNIVILSGEDMYLPIAEKMAAGLSLTVAATIEKPFRTAELRQVLEKIKTSLPTPNKNFSVETAA